MICPKSVRQTNHSRTCLYNSSLVQDIHLASLAAIAEAVVCVETQLATVSTCLAAFACHIVRRSTKAVRTTGNKKVRLDSRHTSQQENFSKNGVIWKNEEMWKPG